jgi:uncharacterized protein involved in exopolysaccharide biosynthesis
MEKERDINNTSHQSNPSSTLEDSDEINLYDYYRVIKRRWKLIALIFFASTIAAAAASLLMTRIYRAETTILPIQSASSGRITSMMGQVGDLPFVSPMLPATSADRLVNILESRTIRESMIKNLALMDVFFPEARDETPSLQDGIRTLGELTTVRKESKGDLLRIAVDFRDPERAARIANQYPVELQWFLNENALSIAKRARIFLGERYLEAKKAAFNGRRGAERLSNST